MLKSGGSIFRTEMSRNHIVRISLIFDRDNHLSLGSNSRVYLYSSNEYSGHSQ